MRDDSKINHFMTVCYSPPILNNHLEPEYAQVTLSQLP